MIATWLRQLRPWRLPIVLLLVAVLASACMVQVQTAKTQAFKDLHRIDTDLVRGVSTRADVLALLGAPDGRGAWVYGKDGDLGVATWDLWVYVRIDVSITKAQHKSLLVFLKGNLYDGYFWTDDALSIDTY